MGQVHARDQLDFKEAVILLPFFSAERGSLDIIAGYVGISEASRGSTASRGS